jgi:hypothetical protein
VSDQVNKLKMPHICNLTRGDCFNMQHWLSCTDSDSKNSNLIFLKSKFSVFISLLSHGDGLEKSNIKIAIPPDQSIHTWIVI